MKDEVNAAVDFLAKLVAKNQDLRADKIEEFRSKMTSVLMSKYKNHWFPDRPSRGQAFRCIRINENIRQDTLLVLVCQDIGINYSDLKMPVELTLWIDPEEVTCRYVAVATRCIDRNINVLSFLSLGSVNIKDLIV